MLLVTQFRVLMFCSDTECEVCVVSKLGLPVIWDLYSI